VTAEPRTAWGRDVRDPELTMAPAPVPGGVEPRLLPPTRESVRAQVATRVATYVPEWTDLDAHDPGIALLRAHGTMAAAVAQRLNRVPRRLALAQIEIAGVRPRAAGVAEGLVAVALAPRAPGVVDVAAGSAFLTAAGAAGVVLETQHGCTALPGTLAAIAVLSDGLTVFDDATDLGGLLPFGRRRRPPAELWWGVDSTVSPAGLLTFAVLLTPPPGRATASASITASADPPPALRWEALTTEGPAELAVERDDTRGLTRDGVIVLRTQTRAPWAPSTLPGRDGDKPIFWLRARLTSGEFPVAPALGSVAVNGVAVKAMRTVRGEVAEPIERRAQGRSRYRLSQAPVIPGSVLLDIADTATDVFGVEGDVSTEWEERATLATAAPDARVFTLDPGTGILTFGDGRAGRAIPAGYRNVVARSYATGAPGQSPPAVGDTLAPNRSVPGLTGATVLALSAASPAESPAQVLARGPASVRSRGRAVAATDYATAALETGSGGVARAHCLAARDVRASGAVAPGTVTVLVVPRSTDPSTPPMPTDELLAEVADTLARDKGVAGVTVVTVAPVYREVAVTALLVGRRGSDLALLESTARDRIDKWLSPLTGGDGTGWAFGGPVRWDALVRVLLADVPDLQAVSSLSFRAGNRRLPVCTDVELAPDELVWPGPHVLESQRGDES
jgi:predicted phage baseplate assembly protein